MAVITAKMVAQLRAKTDAPMMECKKALTEADGDMQKAEDSLRVKLGNKASKASSRVAAEGVVAVSVNDGVAAIVEVNCETDFVTKNPDFIGLASSCARLVADKAPADVAALSALDLDGKSVEATRTELVGRIGENMSIRRFDRVQTSAKIASYLHGTRIGVIVEYEGDDPQVGKDVAMHIAAMKPAALSSEQVDQALIERERGIAAQKAEEDSAKAVAAGKKAQSPEIIARRIEGSVQKFLKEVSLLNQPFVKNDKQSVGQMLKEKNTVVKSYKLYIVGEGIEKKADDFAAEVAAQMAAAKA
ncbi:MAG: translation elongation factor Ts [Oxalobacter sp.]